MKRSLVAVSIALSAVVCSGVAVADGAVFADNGDAAICLDVVEENGLLKIVNAPTPETGVTGTVGAAGEAGVAGAGESTADSTADYISTFSNYPANRYPTPLTLAQ